MGMTSAGRELLKAFFNEARILYAAESGIQSVGFQQFFVIAFFFDSTVPDH
jgi:hypothetical protein